MGFVNEIEGKITNILRNGPRTVRQVSDELKINWITANKYLSYLENFGVVVSTKNKKKLFYLKDPSNYFNLPLTKDQENKIFKIYQTISETAKVTKTQAQKILFQSNKKLKYDLPIGWYQFGPITIKPYQENINYNQEVSSSHKKIIREITREYSSIDNFDLESEIYKQENNKLYLLRKSLLEQSKVENINIYMMDLIMLAPEQTKDLVTDYARAVMLIGWNHKTKELFNLIWKYIAIVNLKNDIQQFYDYNIDIYFKEKIEEVKSEASKILDSLVTSYGDQKYSQEPLYQKFVQHKK